MRDPCKAPDVTANRGANSSNDASALLAERFRYGIVRDNGTGID
jgi:hypothetical protein